MTQPTRSDVHVQAILTQMSLAFMQAESEFVARKLFPMISVSKQADKYFVYQKDQWFRTDAQKRAPGTESAGTGYNLSTDNYFCEVFAVHTDIADQIRANADQPLDMDRDGTLFVARQMLLKLEKEFFAKFYKTGLWTGASDFTPGTLWSASGSDPMKDVRALKRAVKNKTGLSPNKLVVSPDVHDILMDHPAILDRIKYTQRGQITRELIASALELEEYLVAEAIENTAKEGQTASMASIASSKDAMLVYAPKAPGIMTASAGYTFGWNGYAGMEGAQRISKFRMEHLKSDRVECEMAFDNKVVATDLGVFLNNVIA